MHRLGYSYSFFSILLQNPVRNHSNECVRFRSDLFNSEYQSDLLLSIAMKFEEMSLVHASRLLVE